MRAFNACESRELSNEALVEHCSSMSNQQLSGRPNSVYILVDDLRYRDVDLDMTGLKVLRSPHVKTPRLTELASESPVLERVDAR